MSRDQNYLPDILSDDAFTMCKYPVVDPTARYGTGRKETCDQPQQPLIALLNIDCTILFALVSDLSLTANHPILPRYYSAMTWAVELEPRENLPSSLWPAMADQNLIYTHDAAKRMKEIIDSIGTPNERARIELLLDDGHPDRGDNCEKFSLHTVTTPFPNRIVQVEVSEYDIRNAIQGIRLPPVAL